LSAQPRFSSVVASVAASAPVAQLGDLGNVAVSPVGARVVAMAFAPNDENLFWSNPQLNQAEVLRDHPESLVGGIGGERLWFSPELAYHWNGEPDWETFSNYTVPPAMDPGSYEFVDRGQDAATLQAEVELAAHGTAPGVAFEITRTIRIVEPPPVASHLAAELTFVGFEASHQLVLASDSPRGVVDLWHLLQVPSGSTLIVPISPDADAHTATPLSYGLPGGWVERPGHLRWRFTGLPHAKVGLSVDVVTGRSAVIRQLGSGMWSMIVRDFPLHRGAVHVDHPYNTPRNDQAFQAWDGYGFGEMELHTPAIDAAHGPRQIDHTHRIWAFGGSRRNIAQLAEALLGVPADVSEPDGLLPRT
jgi:hypothetical protein